MWVIDGNNVMGAGADGWWTDPTGAAVRLAEAVMAWCAATVPGPVILVFDGRPEPRLQQVADTPLLIDFARRGGPDAADDRIVELVEEWFGDHPALTVITSDRGLRDRLPPGVVIEGAGRFRERIDLPTPSRQRRRR